MRLAGHETWNCSIDGDLILSLSFFLPYQSFINRWRNAPKAALALGDEGR
jgi:hypothetical protein